MTSKTDKALLALADGSLFWGRAFGAAGEAVGEVIFNTSMTGYQEIITDPSYAKQIVTLTHPHIGNVGVNAEDAESSAIHASGLVIRSLPKQISNWRASSSISEFLESRNVIGIEQIDTRQLTRLIRTKGSQDGCIATGPDIDAEHALAKARSFGGLKGMDLAKVVTTHDPYPWKLGLHELGYAVGPSDLQGRRRFSVIAYDFGVKHNILRMLVGYGCEVAVVPAQMPPSDLEEVKVDGIFLSNGPGDPEPCGYAIESIREFMRQKIPIFGICLGHQLLALASGAKTEKMKFGHHGANHPVKDLDTNEIMITSQNHGFAVSDEDFPANLRVTHRSLFDGTIQGIEHATLPAFSFQGHPEASPGPHDAGGLFRKFLALMNRHSG